MSAKNKKVRHAVFEAAGWRCRECGRRGGLTIDHIVPRSRGGTGHRSNLQALCGDCNQRKASTMPGDHRPEQFAACQQCSGRGVMQLPFGKRCSLCGGRGVTKARLTRRQRRVRGLAT